MLKKTFFFVILIIVALNAKSQITKGYWLAGGSASLDSREPGFNSYFSSSQQIIVEASCDIGYFFADKFVAGIKPSYQGSWFNQPNVAVIDQYNILEVGPFARYYFRNKDEKVNIFSELTYQYGKQWGNHGTVTIHSNSITPLVGCAAFINDCVAIEITLGYSSLYYIGYKGVDNSIIAGIGFQFHLIK